MNKYLIVLALETLLEQVVDSRENSNDNKERIKEIEEQINIIKNIQYEIYKERIEPDEVCS